MKHGETVPSKCPDLVLRLAPIRVACKDFVSRSSCSCDFEVGHGGSSGHETDLQHG